MKRVSYVKRTVCACLAMYFAGLLFAGVARAEPVCALLDSAKLPLTTLLEARLQERPNTTWVERTEIDRILGERELAAAFGADGVSNRAALGALVKADVLVLLRSVSNPIKDGPPLIECVVCETKRGLRLKTTAVPKAESGEATVEALAVLVEQGLQKYAEQIETLVAVPPFLSEDLGFEFNYLQTAYSKLVEEALLAQPGLLVIELGEAQAISRELTIADGQVERLAKKPFYILGRYRHDGIGKSRTMRMSLRLMQSEQQLTLKGINDQPLPETPSWIRAKTAELLPLMELKNLAAQDDVSAADEARAIAARGRQFYKVSNWNEALALFEASLLLDPSQDDVRRDIIVALTQVAWTSHHKKADLEAVTGLTALFSRGLEHLEKYAGPDKELSKHETGVAQLYDLSLGMFSSDTKSLGEPLRKQYDDLTRRRKETFLRIAYARAKAGQTDHPENAWDAKAVSGLQETELFSTILRVSEEWRDLPDLPIRLERMTFRHYVTVDDSPVFRDFLTQLQRSERADVRNAAQRILLRAEKGWRDKAEMAKRTAPAEPTEIDPRLETIRLSHASRAGVSFDGAIPAQPGVDVFWKNALLCTMRAPGKVEDYFAYSQLNLFISAVVYDGEYVWVTGKRIKQPPVLIALDPRGKAVEFTSEDGLPDLSDSASEMKLAPIGRGKVCIAGFSGRTWIASAEVAPGGKRKFEILLEAREAVTGADPLDVANVHAAFRPTRLFTLTNDEGRSVIIIGRNASSGTVSARPLILDPHTKSAKVAGFTCHGWDHGGDKFAVPAKDSLYFFEAQGNNRPNLMRVRYPGNEKEICVQGCPDGWLAADNRGLHVIGKQWLLVDVSAGYYQSVVDRPAWYYSNGFATGKSGGNKDFGVNFSNTSTIAGVFSTQHYGPVVRVQKGRETHLYRLNLNSAK